MSDDILLEERPFEGVALLRLNRPEVFNALNLALRHALAEAFCRLDADQSVRVLVLAGGPRAFCAGADLNEYVDATPMDLLARRHDLLWGPIAACRKPVIAAVRGHALGGGCELALHADMILAGRSARFGQPEVKVGIMPGGGATQRLTRALGKFGAMKLLLLGEPIGAETALQCGLVAEVLDDDAVEATALALAQQLGELPAVALRLIKESVLMAMETPLSAGLEYERNAFQTAFASPDKHEGMRARLDKRPANFSKSPKR
ncbi:enoyl-CoA hydratase-related protein [Pantoea sp. 18069]|uniref:enoyl-CoA hydratase-related protein n=1 Tax=Pantoea sp. 18069 TaxID=2681415 RepID=UPI0013572173|nr:enoyl-CoA hydratase-related protein [Pantoea sp. 18069]